MRHTIRGLGLVATLLLVSATAVFSQASTASTSSTAAYVYVQIQGAEGAVYGFNASSTGKLSAIPGAPWKPAGQIIGDNQHQFFTLGDENLYSYGVSSNGAIGSEVSHAALLDYAGGACGSGKSGANGAVLDHTGSYVYVMLEYGGDDGCAAYQTYAISKAGQFDFAGDTEITNSGEEGATDFGLPSILGNETFAFSQFLDSFGPVISSFKRTNSGVLEYQTNSGISSPGDDIPVAPDADPSGNYVVMQLYPGDGPPGQLGSYEVASNGDLSTANTTSDMPAITLNSPSSTFSPAGDLFVLYSGKGTGDGNGISIYHFNGAKPLTLYKTLLAGTPINQVAWDSSNHLYAISQPENKLYVFTVTSSSVTEDTAWPIGAPFKMIVVSEASSSTAAPAAQFTIPLLTTTGTPSVVGQVTVDTSGNTTVQVTGRSANASYGAEFCPAVATGDYKTPACFDIVTVRTDGSGNGSTTAKFPKPGDWAGDFLVGDSAGPVGFLTGLYPGVSDETYLSKLLPETTTNGGVVVVPIGSNKVQDPLISGSVSYSKSTVTVTLNGAFPDRLYETAESPGVYLDTSSGYGLYPDITTDSHGDGRSSGSLTIEGGDMFQVQVALGQGAGFIGGFSVP
jgi:hypothetical protein